MRVSSYGEPVVSESIARVAPKGKCRERGGMRAKGDLSKDNVIELPLRQLGEQEPPLAANNEAVVIQQGLSSFLQQ